MQSSPEIQVPGVSDIMSAWTAHHYAYAAALALVLLVALVRRYAGPRWPWLHTDAGSSVLVLLGSFGASLATALSGGAPLTLNIAWAALGVATTAAGGYALLKQLLVTPILCKWEASAGSTTKKVLRAVLWVFCHRSDPEAQCTDGAKCDPAPTTNAAPGAGTESKS